MQISVIGFPRIGTLRELKFASEKYFKKEIEAGELLQKAQELRKTHWLTQKNAGITYISSNDFSFYDMVLDTAALLGIVPKQIFNSLLSTASLICIGLYLLNPLFLNDCEVFFSYLTGL